jgi:hypothetical protein
VVSNNEGKRPVAGLFHLWKDMIGSKDGETLKDKSGAAVFTKYM